MYVNCLCTSVQFGNWIDESCALCFVGYFYDTHQFSLNPLYNSLPKDIFGCSLKFSKKIRTFNH